MTMRQFAALHKRLRVERIEHDYRAGVIASAVMNFSMGRAEGSSPVMPHDLFPSIPQPVVEEMTPEQALRQAKLMEAQFAKVKFS